MNEFKGLAEVADRLIYELIALLLPGLMFALLLAGTIGALFLGSDSLQECVSLGAQHAIISTGFCYALGYVVQGFSRPVVRPVQRLIRKARSGHRKGPFVGADSARSVPLNLEKIAAAKLRESLGLSQGSFGRTELTALAYASASPALHRLERFRAAASCVRGLATVTLFCWLWSLGLLSIDLFARGASTVIVVRAATVVGLSFAFLALAEREKMYERTWRLTVMSEFIFGMTKHGRLTELKDRPA